MLQRRGDHYDDGGFSPCISFFSTVARACCCCLPARRRRRRGYSTPPTTEQSLLHTIRQETTPATTAAPPLVANMAAGTTSTTAPTPSLETSERQVLLSPKQQALQSDTTSSDQYNKAAEQVKLKGEIGKIVEENKSYELEDDSDACPTCLEPFTEENPRVVAKCGHEYHLPCIYEWLERSSTCPMCGKKMEYEEFLS